MLRLWRYGCFVGLVQLINLRQRSVVQRIIERIASDDVVVAKSRRQMGSDIVFEVRTEGLCEQVALRNLLVQGQRWAESKIPT